MCTLTHSRSPSHSLPFTNACCYHFYFISFTIARTPYTHHTHIKWIWVKRFLLSKSCLFMCIHVICYIFKPCCHFNETILCDDIYVFDIYHIGEGNFLFLLRLNTYRIYMCQTLYVHVFDIFIVLCLHVCRYTVSYIHTIMSMCRRKNNTLNAHLRTLPTIISYDLFVLCISLLVDIMISYIKYKK